MLINDLQLIIWFQALVYQNHVIKRLVALAAASRRPPRLRRGKRCLSRDQRVDFYGVTVTIVVLYQIRPPATTTTRNVSTPKGRLTWWPSPPSRWWFRRYISESYGRISDRQWTKVHEILRRCRGSFVVFNAVSQLSISCSPPEIWIDSRKQHLHLHNRRRRHIGGCQLDGEIAITSCSRVDLQNESHSGHLRNLHQTI